VNIASGDCVPIRDVILSLADCLGRPDLVRLGARPPVPGEPPRLAAGLTVLRDRLGFRPVYSQAAGLAATAAWWRTQNEQPAVLS
jgi:nucleoside-diphosphate-sugar epimerase